MTTITGQHHPLNPATLLDGLELKVYQAKSYPDSPGRWHAHIVPPRGWRNYWRALGIHHMTPDSGTPWTAASGETEQEARDEACEIIGRLYGARLAEAMRPYTPPPPGTIDPPKEIKF